MKKFKRSLFVLSASFATFIPFIPFTISALPSDSSISKNIQANKALESKPENQAENKSAGIESGSTKSDCVDKLVEAPLSVSDRSDEDVLAWAQRKVRSAFSYNWVDYKEITEQSKVYFGDQGYDHYLKSLKDSGNIASVVDKKLILQTRPNGAAKLLKQAPYQDKYSWQVEVPVVFSYYGVNDVVTAHATVILLISRAAKADFEDGLSITQLVLKPEK